MRWAFWRTRAFDGPLEPDPLSRATWAAPRAPSRDREVEDPVTAAAFSGAQPDPGRGPAPRDEQGPAPEGAAFDAVGIRADLLALIDAAEAVDDARVVAVLERLAARGPDEPEVAALIALELLGDRLLVAAGRASWDEPAEGSDLEAALEHGTAVAGRAAALLRAVAAGSSPGDVRVVVRAAAEAGLGEPASPPVDHLQAQDVLRVAAVLLAQTVRDDGGADELAQELAELLPD
jgi:hypothetical protein